jgi:hypothetical protein
VITGQIYVPPTQPPGPITQNSERAVLTNTLTGCASVPTRNLMVDQLPSIPSLAREGQPSSTKDTLRFEWTHHSDGARETGPGAVACAAQPRKAATSRLDSIMPATLDMAGALRQRDGNDQVYRLIMETQSTVSRNNIQPADQMFSMMVTQRIQTDNISKASRSKPSNQAAVLSRNS